MANHPRRPRVHAQEEIDEINISTWGDPNPGIRPPAGVFSLTFDLHDHAAALQAARNLYESVVRQIEETS